MLIILKSVEAVLDTSSICIHPLNKDNSYEPDNISLDDVTPEWWDTLSIEDFDTVNCCI